MAYRPSPLESLFGGDLFRLRNALRAITSLLLSLIPNKKARHKLRDKIDDAIIKFNNDKIEYFVSNYPKVRTEAETINRIVEQKLSIARYGDGEFNMCIGRNKSFQDYDENLVQQLKSILKSENSNVLVGIYTIKNSKDLTTLMKKFVVRRGNRVLQLFDNAKTYDSSTITTIFPTEKKAFNEHVSLLKKIWDKRKVLFVVGKDSRFFYEEELFDNINQHEFIYGPAKNAFSHYDDLMEQIQQYDKDWLIMISLGPTATIMAYDLAKKGFQAIDLGQTPSKYRRAKYGELYPEGHHLHSKK
ncbi:MAG: GT-D fold domain-containing glycosyltransferase [Amphritea sp.]